VPCGYCKRVCNLPKRIFEVKLGGRVTCSNSCARLLQWHEVDKVAAVERRK